MQAKNISTTAVETDTTPFIPGTEAVAIIEKAVTAIVLNGSDDGTTYTALVSGSTSVLTVKSFTIPKYMKASAASVNIIGGP